MEFIKQHPQEINLGKVDQTWFLDILVLRDRGLHGVSGPSLTSDGCEEGGITEDS